MASTKHVQLAQSLPPKLLRFFARHPPAILRAGAADASSSPSTSTSTSATTPVAEITSPRIQAGYENPFKATKNEQTGKWRPPVYSLRRQAELAKLAHAHGVAELLPFTSKSLTERTKKREQQGLRVRGTGVGQKVKGHWWERALRHRLEARREAMRAMPKMVNEWRRLGHGRGWKNWPGKGK